VSDPFAGLSAYAREHVRTEAQAHELRRQAAIKKNAPSWAKFRAEQELKALIDEVEASGGEVTPEHRARAGRLLASLGGNQP